MDSRGLSQAKISYIPNQRLSQLLPYSNFILALCLITVIITVFIAERWILRAIYPCIFAELEEEVKERGNDRRRKGFVYSHLAGSVKLILLLVAFDPAYRLLIGNDSFDSPVSPGSIVTLGDTALVVMQVYSSYYIWELCYRASQASYINIAHHAGLLVIGQLAVSLCAEWEAHEEAIIEFYLCIIWGCFDLVSEWPISIALIYRRVKSENHFIISRVFMGCAVWCLCFTATEIAVTIYLLQQSWDRWGLQWRIATPVVFSLWCFAQAFSSKQIFEIGLSERRKGLRSTNLEKEGVLARSTDALTVATGSNGANKLPSNTSISSQTKLETPQEFV